MMDEDMIKHNPDQPIVKGWTLDRKINIFGTIGFLLAISSWVWNISDRVEANARNIASHKEVLSIQIADLKEDRIHTERISAERFTEILLKLNRIEDKVDRHTESTSTHRNSNG